MHGFMLEKKRSWQAERCFLGPRISKPAKYFLPHSYDGTIMPGYPATSVGVISADDPNLDPRSSESASGNNSQMQQAQRSRFPALSDKGGRSSLVQMIDSNQPSKR